LGTFKDCGAEASAVAQVQPRFELRAKS
jgi:hypothetical protein